MKRATPQIAAAQHPLHDAISEGITEAILRPSVLDAVAWTPEEQEALTLFRLASQNSRRAALMLLRADVNGEPV